MNAKSNALVTQFMTFITFQMLFNFYINKTTQNRKWINSVALPVKYFSTVTLMLLILKQNNTDPCQTAPICQSSGILTQCILVDSSTVICWTSPFVILGVPALKFVTFILFFIENPVSKQCRPWSDATWCGIWSWSAMFAYDLFEGFKVRMG